MKDENTNTLPCPFCGYNDVRASIESTPFGKFGVCKCQICGTTMHGVGVMVPEDGGPPDELIASAIAAWNQRTTPRGDTQ